MTDRGPIGLRACVLGGGSLALLCLVSGCGGGDTKTVQGYVEGEFVYVAAPSGGALEALSVRRGAHVKTGDPLFALDKRPERDARDEAQRRLVQAQAMLEDLKKGKRPPEIASVEAQLRQAREALALSEVLCSRQERLLQTSATTPEEADRARSARDQDRQRVAQLQSDLETARLPARSDQIVAQEATVRALEATLAKAQWDLDQKRQPAPKDGEVFDVLYFEGEWVPAGKPVVALLPPENVKVRAFVSQTRVGSIHVGDGVRVRVDGVAEAFVGQVSFISPRAEYTPPVIYSRESREKLVFLIEARFDRETAAKLHPGQPVDVQFDR
jgi:HlyD family secretion protein